MSGFPNYLYKTETFQTERSFCISMADVKVSHDELVEGFLEVFRSVGYDGASLEALATSSGLKKSSLYHRFPGGKQQMATEVLKFGGHWVSANITNVLREEGNPNTRLKKALRNVSVLYAGGKSACILRALSMDSGLDLFSQLIQGAFEDWIGGFSKIAVEFGFEQKEARRMAEDIVVRIQGSLIVGRGTGDKSLFKRTLNEIEGSLTTLK